MTIPSFLRLSHGASFSEEVGTRLPGGVELESQITFGVWKAYAREEQGAALVLVEIEGVRVSFFFDQSVLTFSIYGTEISATALIQSANGSVQILPKTWAELKAELVGICCDVICGS